MHPIHNPPPQSPLHQPFKLLGIPSKQICRLVIQRIVRIRLVKQENQPINNRVNIQNGLPILAQNVQTNFSLQVDVGMVNLGLAMNFGRRVWVVIGYVEFEFVGGVFPEAGVGGYGNFEHGEVVGVGKFDVGHLSTVEFGDV